MLAAPLTARPLRTENTRPLETPANQPVVALVRGSKTPRIRDSLNTSRSDWLSKPSFLLPDSYALLSGRYAFLDEEVM